MREIEATKGDFTLFALLRRADAPGSWDLVVSAPWLEAGTLRATTVLVGLLTDALGAESLKDFARIVPLGIDAPIVRFILNSFPVDDELDGEALGVASTDLRQDYGVDDAIVFKAKGPEGNGRLRKAHAGATRGRA